jgi:ribosome biogenesis protein ENP2
MLGINSIEFNRTTGKILSSDAKSLRIYDKNSGELFTSVEPGYAINKIVPSLGPAPKFCSFLDNLTEEMEETNTSSVYDEYKFLTMEELEKLNGKHLIGGKFLKSYMHGYILKSRMYDKVKFSSK